MKRTFPCIVCPNGCEIEAEQSGGRLTLSGAACKRGEAYVRQELTAPRRTIATSVRLLHGELPLVSVRLEQPVDRALISSVMEEIRKIRLEAPVHIGQVIIENVLGSGSNVIITKNVDRTQP